MTNEISDISLTCGRFIGVCGECANCAIAADADKPSACQGECQKSRWSSSVLLAPLGITPTLALQERGVKQRCRRDTKLCTPDQLVRAIGGRSYFSLCSYAASRQVPPDAEDLANLFQACFTGILKATKSTRQYLF